MPQAQSSPVSAVAEAAADRTETVVRRVEAVLAAEVAARSRVASLEATAARKVESPCWAGTWIDLRAGSGVVVVAVVVAGGRGTASARRQGGSGGRAAGDDGRRTRPRLLDAGDAGDAGDGEGKRDNSLVGRANANALADTQRLEVWRCREARLEERCSCMRLRSVATSVAAVVGPVWIERLRTWPAEEARG